MSEQKRSGIMAWLKKITPQSFDRRDRMSEPDPRVTENDDGWTQGYSGDQFPPNYVPPADEGRPRH
jgi:hypothetical protein